MPDPIEYTDVVNPNFAGIAEAVAPMLKIGMAVWEENLSKLTFYLSEDLTTEERTQLDTIVTENSGGA